MSDPDPTIEHLKERAWQEVAAINQALVEGRIDEAGWHEAMASLIKPAYLAAENPYAQAGHGGDAATWEASRGFIAEAIHRSGTFLDVGCASGILIDTPRICTIRPSRRYGWPCDQPCAEAWRASHCLCRHRRSGVEVR